MNNDNTGLDKFTSMCSKNWVHNFTCASGQALTKKGHTKSKPVCMSDQYGLMKKQLETFIFVLCYLNNACSLNFYCNSIKSFCNEAFAL